MAIATERDHLATRGALAGWLAARTGEPATVGELSIPGLSGFSNETILCDATIGGETRGLVIRVEPTGHQVFPSTAFDSQVEVLRALGRTGSVAVPEVLWFEEDPSILGDRFLVMNRLDGRVPADNPSYHAAGWVTGLTEDQRTALWRNGVEAMASVHGVDRRAAGLGWIPVVEPAELLAQTLAYRDFACGDHPMPSLEEALALLASSVPDPVSDPALCWGDSRLGNLMFADDMSVVAVLDWEMVTAGDPVQDLSWYLLIDRHHHEGFGVPRLAGLPDRDETVAQWETATGRSAAHLGWYELLGAVRYAAIMTRVMFVLEDSGIFPGAAEMMYEHTGTALLERMLAEGG